MKVLQEIADLAFWGPRGPEGGNHPGAATFTSPDAILRCGMILATLAKQGVRPSGSGVPSTLRAPLEAAEVRAGEIARLLKGVMPEGWGFVLCLADFGDEGFKTYMSSIDRRDSVAFLREMATAIERQDRSL